MLVDKRWCVTVSANTYTRYGITPQYDHIIICMIADKRDTTRPLTGQVSGPQARPCHVISYDLFFTLLLRIGGDSSQQLQNSLLIGSNPGQGCSGGTGLGPQVGWGPNCCYLHHYYTPWSYNSLQSPNKYNLSLNSLFLLLLINIYEKIGVLS